MLAVTGPDGARESDFSDGPPGTGGRVPDRHLAGRRPDRGPVSRRSARKRTVCADRARAEEPHRFRPGSNRRGGPAVRGLSLLKDGRADSLRQAAESFTKSRAIWNVLGERFFEGLCLLREGVSRRKLGEHHRARDLFQEALPLWRALEEPSFEAKTLDALGTADYFLSDHEKALEHYLEALPLRRAAGDREGEAATLNNISIGHGVLGRLRTSLEWQEQALALQRELGDRRGQASLLHNMAVVSFRTSRMQEALDRLQEALSLSRAVGDRQQEASTVGTLGMVYGFLGEPREALRALPPGARPLECRSATAVARRPPWRRSAGPTRRSARRSGPRALPKALDLHRTLGDRAESATLLSMGMAYKDLGDLENAAPCWPTGCDSPGRPRASPGRRAS